MSGLLIPTMGFLFFFPVAVPDSYGLQIIQYGVTIFGLISQIYLICSQGDRLQDSVRLEKIRIKIQIKIKSYKNTHIFSIQLRASTYRMQSIPPLGMSAVFCIKKVCT